MATINGTEFNDDGTVNGDGILHPSLISSSVGDVVNGLAGDDMLTAANNNVTLNGGSGNDWLQSSVGVDGTIMEGGSGGDVLWGDGTNDTASYANDLNGVVVDLSNNSATDGTGAIDYLNGIENVTGSGYDDILTGDSGANVLQGGAGNDTLTGGLVGGVDADVFKYSFDLTQGGGETFRFTDFHDAAGIVKDGEVADGTSQGQFSSLYTQWLHSLGLTVVDLGQNSGPDGTPVVQGPDGTFGERDSFTWTSGSAKKLVTHERWYSDTWSSGSGGGQPTVRSGDGFDTINDFAWGVDQLEFNGLAGLSQSQFTSLFAVTPVGADGNGDGILDDTLLALQDGSWEVTLLGVSGHAVGDFYGSIS